MRTLERIREQGMRLRLAVTVAVGVVLLSQLAVTSAILGGFDVGVAIVDVVVAGIVLGAALLYIGSSTRERARHAVESLLPDVLLQPGTIEETAREALDALVGAGVADAGVLAVADDASADEGRPLAAIGYPPGWVDGAPSVRLPEAGPPSVGQEQASHPWLRPLASRLGGRLWVARVPLASGGAIGLLVLVSRERGRLADVGLLETVSAQLTAALDHAALYEASYQRERDLEEQEARRREFLAALSHEIRTPLTSIQAFAELLALERESMDSTAEQLVGSLSQGVERLGALVNDLIDLGRVQDAQLQVRPAPVDVLGTLELAETILRPAFLLREQSLTLEVPAAPLRATADVRYLEQVVLNLLSNANRHTPPGGAITVRALGEAGRVRIEVEDNGPGVPASERERIFEAYYRAPRSDAPAVPGSGLGLAVARRLTELQGGRIWVEDVAGGGARFCVELRGAT